MVRRGAGCAAAFVAFFSCASAQENFDSSRASAEVHASGVYTDNFYYGTGDDPRESAIGAVLAPSAKYKATKGRLDLFAGAGAEVATFNREPADDYEDGALGLNASWL